MFFLLLSPAHHCHRDGAVAVVVVMVVAMVMPASETEGEVDGDGGTIRHAAPVCIRRQRSQLHIIPVSSPSCACVLSLVQAADGKTPPPNRSDHHSVKRPSGIG